ncbi:MAG TPA: type IV toxin-antitoxin system AbiEi family antitoxin [Alphaproteobacteria bacterium]|nr:type IV toxin-antitoxin system AbiEi family antitoxin [Alphaproteobacteria bacterium]
MIKNDSLSKTLSTYVDSLQKQGKIVFHIDEAASILGITLTAARLSAYRLSKKKRIFRAYRNFYVIVPLEYQEIGCPPPDWFIDPLMHHLGTEYYVGLLTAAALHGAAHQQPMIFQVITSKYPRLITLPSMDIRLYQSSYIQKTGIELKKTAAGYLNLSTPELTAFDLVRYARASGHYNHVATVLAELAEEIRGKRLATLAKTICQDHGEWIYWQRLGYILDSVGFKDIAEPLATLIEKSRPSLGYFVSGKTENVIEKSSRWRLYINTTLEADI